MEFIIGDTREKNNSYKIIRRSQLLDLLLEPWKEVIGRDYVAYKNHALRTINYCYFILNPDEKTLQEIVITSAYHQIGLWIENNNKYPVSSSEILLADSEKIGFYPVPEHILLAIITHQNLSHEFKENEDFSFAFWRAFRIEISMGYSEQGVPSDFIEQVRKCIPTHNYNKKVTEKLILSFAKKLRIV